jgi:hypothetical protein
MINNMEFEFIICLAYHFHQLVKTGERPLVQTVS